MTQTAGQTILGIVGVGAIAAAIVEGLSTGATAPAILLSPRNAGLAAGLATRFPHVEVARDNRDVVARASVLILSVRPQDAASALSDLPFSETQSIVSVMANVPLARLRPLVSPARDISRAIPLPTVAYRLGLTPIYPATRAAKGIFEPLGGTLDLADETALEALSAASATVAAHLAYLDAIAEWLAGRDVPTDQARRFVSSIFAGLSSSLRVDAPDFARLAHEHATAGGLNEQFRGDLEAAGLLDEVKAGLDRLFDRLMPPPPTRTAD